MAAERGADWVILQPPPRPASSRSPRTGWSTSSARSPTPRRCRSRSRTRRSTSASGLSSGGLDRLSRDHPNVRLLKAEGSALDTRALIELTEGRMAVFQGRGGMEFIDVMRAGCVGMIPSVESCHVQSRMFELMQTGRAEDEAEAERLYAHLAPLIVFLMQSVGQFVCYGKRLTARRIGVAEVHDRQPAQAPTAFGLDCLSPPRRRARPAALATRLHSRQVVTCHAPSSPAARGSSAAICSKSSWQRAGRSPRCTARPRICRRSSACRSIWSRAI